MITGGFTFGQMQYIKWGVVKPSIVSEFLNKLGNIIISKSSSTIILWKLLIIKLELRNKLLF